MAPFAKLVKVLVLLGLSASAGGISLGSKRVNSDARHNQNTHISVINATPYRWRKTYNHSYQLTGWEGGWPQYMEPGRATTVKVETWLYGAPWDSAGEATYSIEGTSEPMSLQVQFRAGKQHEAYVQFREGLRTAHSSKARAAVRLGFSRDEGGVGFVLAGTEGDFLCNDAPAGWMQAQLSAIGHLPLREIALPRSHHAGQWRSSKVLGVAMARNTQTQTRPLSEQLGAGGVRVLDLRPALMQGRFYEHHGSRVGPAFNGVLGASVAEMVDMQNRFMARHPGELFIWDIHEAESRDGDRGFDPLDDRGRLALYDALRRLHHRTNLSDHEGGHEGSHEGSHEGADVSRRPLRDFIGRRRSSVLIRLPTAWASRKHFPGPGEGFVSGARLPLQTRWSDTNDVAALVDDQVAWLRRARASRSSEMHNMDWLLTQKGLQIPFPMQFESIVELSVAAWRTLYQEFWEALTDTSYPNWITMDDIRGNSLKAMAMVINKCFAARQCGALGGKVTGVANATTALGISLEPTRGNGTQA